MTYSQSSGCCQLVEIYGFGQTPYDGFNRNRQTSIEEFETELTNLETILDRSYSIKILTLNDHQYRHFGPSLQKLGWSLASVADSLGHNTVVFLYTKNSNLVTKDKIVERLTKNGLDLDKIPVQRKRKKIVDKVEV